LNLSISNLLVETVGDRSSRGLVDDSFPRWFVAVVVIVIVVADSEVVVLVAVVACTMVVVTRQVARIGGRRREYHCSNDWKK